MSNETYYKVGGSLEYQHPAYVVRQADFDLYERLMNGEFCYVLNSRQMGKSSLRVQMMKKLKEQGIKCASIDMTRIGSHVTPTEWYAGVTSELLRGFGLSRKVNFSSWWRDRKELPSLQCLKELIEDVLLTELSQNVVIFLDEIDSILKIKFKDDFFAFIRACYNQRVDNPEYKRLAFCLLGVATPSDLIADKQRTPFNIGQAIELTGFKLEEAEIGLIKGLAEKIDNPDKVLEEILDWTGGQPFLTQKLCQLVVEKADSTTLNIEQLVQKYLIDNWEAQDEPEHLRTIRDRILQDENQAVSLLGLYQQILQQGEVAVDDSPEQTELRLSGLVVRQEGKLRAYNRVYELVFNLNWVEQELGSIRPYAEALTAWLASNYQDESRLLFGQELRDAQSWAEGKSLSVQDYKFLATSQEKNQKQTNKILHQIVCELVSPLSVDEVSPQLAHLLERLREVSGDDSLKLLKIKTGSTILVLQCSQEGFERIKFLFSTGQLPKLLGIPIQDVRDTVSEPITSESSHQKTTPRAREHKTGFTLLDGFALSDLVREACRHPAGSTQRQRYLTRIIRQIVPRLWRENTPYYQDALQQTWVYFCQNICEGNTGAAYNPERGNVVTWLNYYLKRRLQDFYTDDRKRKDTFVSKKVDDFSDTHDPLDNIAAEPDVPPLLEQVRQWVETDPSGELSSIHIANRPDVTAQILILRRLPPEVSWKALSAELNLPIATLSSFYQQQCLPCLRKFGELEGYL